MPLVTSEEMLSKAQKGGYAVGAFNVENMEMVKAVIAAAEELKAPVMLQPSWQLRQRKQAYRFACIWTTAAVLIWLFRQSKQDTLLL